MVEEGLSMTIIKKCGAAAAAGALAFALAACTGSSGKSAAVQSYDFDSISADESIAAMVPEKYRDTLKVASDIPYSPAEFFDDDKQAAGYEIDVLKAMAKVMGIKNVEVSDEEFDAIIPKLNDGTYDVSFSSMTLNRGRMQEVNMVAYIQAGFIFGTQKGNPKNFDPISPCGFKVATQADTTQADYIAAVSASCKEMGKKPVAIVADSNQDALMPKVIDGSIDAIIGESPMLAYAQNTNEKFEVVGETFQVAPQGPVTAKNNPELAKAIQAALQKMMDTGLLTEVLAPWGEESIALHYATLNPPIA